jgi:hypothetical protein
MWNIQMNFIMYASVSLRVFSSQNPKSVFSGGGDGDNETTQNNF